MSVEPARHLVSGEGRNARVETAGRGDRLEPGALPAVSFAVSDLLG